MTRVLGWLLLVCGCLGAGWLVGLWLTEPPPHECPEASSVVYTTPCSCRVVRWSDAD